VSQLDVVVEFGETLCCLAVGGHRVCVGCTCKSGWCGRSVRRADVAVRATRAL
jgi:hypothetical protein